MASSPPDLEERDRILGYQNLRLIGNWQAWILRRVESIEYETANSIRRQVSVDLRLHGALFGPPVFHWGIGDEDVQDVHYVPVAFLKKGPLTRFDVRDEEGRALPVMGRRMNSRIAAATMSALAQSLMAAQLHLGESSLREVSAPQLVVPRTLEQDFWRLAYFNCEGGDEDASVLYDSIVAMPTGELTPVVEWPWREEPSTRWRADVDDEMWRWALFTEPSFFRLAYDFSRLFTVAVPLVWRDGQRRIVKFGYTQHLDLPESRAMLTVKRAVAGLQLAKLWDCIEDKLEGVPRHNASRDSWIPDAGNEHRRLSLQTRLFRSLGWGTTEIPFDAPAVGHAATYHLDVAAPPGIQIRRAQLLISEPDIGRSELPARRGIRNVRRVHLYASGVRQGASAEARCHFRPESSFIVRAATLGGVLTALILTVLVWFAGDIRDQHAEAAAAILAVLPGVIALYAAGREEHPLATSLVFGLRVLSVLPGVLAIAAGCLIVIDRPDGVLGWSVVVAAWLVAVVLTIGWRLSARGRADPRALT